MGVEAMTTELGVLRALLGQLEQRVREVEEAHRRQQLSRGGGRQEAEGGEIDMRTLRQVTLRTLY
jgi:hypothetical protein